MKKFLEEFEKIGLAVIIALVLISLALASFLVLLGKPKQYLPPVSRKEAEVETKKTSPIKFAEETLQLAPASSFSLKVVPTDKLSALVYRLEIFFDPGVLVAEDMIAGDFFENPQILRKELDNESGRLYFSAGVTPHQVQETGEPESENLLATIFFRVKPRVLEEELETTVLFGEKTMIMGKETQWENFNNSLKPATIIISLP